MTATLPSLAQLLPNRAWAKLPLFNRKNWSRFRFGDVVENVNERVEPSTAAADNTHLIVERIVADIDDIVKKVRFPDWQHTTQGERLVQKELRRTLLKYKLHTDQDLFDKAYGYIRQYY
jgi:hypothetical protein